MGDWVAHPTSTTARKILVIYQLSGDGNPESPCIRKQTDEKISSGESTQTPLLCLSH
jgi:hypothetical protein